MKRTASQFVVRIRNKDYPASLELRKQYRVLPIQKQQNISKFECGRKVPLINRRINSHLAQIFLNKLEASKISHRCALGMPPFGTFSRKLLCKQPPKLCSKLLLVVSLDRRPFEQNRIELRPQLYFFDTKRTRLPIARDDLEAMVLCPVSAHVRHRWIHLPLQVNSSGPGVHSHGQTLAVI
jgi:hypothetical protein